MCEKIVLIVAGWSDVCLKAHALLLKQVEYDTVQYEAVLREPVSEFVLSVSVSGKTFIFEVKETFRRGGHIDNRKDFLDLPDPGFEKSPYLVGDSYSLPDSVFSTGNSPDYRDLEWPRGKKPLKRNFKTLRH